VNCERGEPRLIVDGLVFTVVEEWCHAIRILSPQHVATLELG
jgi:hypothetical protein